MNSLKGLGSLEANTSRGLNLSRALMQKCWEVPNESKEAILFRSCEGTIKSKTLNPKPFWGFPVFWDARSAKMLRGTMFLGLGIQKDWVVSVFSDSESAKMLRGAILFDLYPLKISNRLVLWFVLGLSSIFASKPWKVGPLVESWAPGFRAASDPLRWYLYVTTARQSSWFQLSTILWGRMNMLQTWVLGGYHIYIYIHKKLAHTAHVQESLGEVMTMWCFSGSWAWPTCGWGNCNIWV